MKDLGWNARTLGVLLHLGDLNRAGSCMGYANACVCPECTERAELPPALEVRQPWEIAA